MLDFPTFLALERQKTETEKLWNAAQLRVIHAADMYEWAIEQNDRNWILTYGLQLDRADAEESRLFVAVQAERNTQAINAQTFALAHAA